MFMRFLGGGIGHKATDFVRQRRPETIRDVTEYDIQEEEIAAEDIEDPHQVEDADLEEDGDMEEVDPDEEGDFGYADGEGQEAEGSEQEIVSEDEEDEYDL
jgi:hypothetical protein